MPSRKPFLKGTELRALVVSLILIFIATAFFLTPLATAQPSVESDFMTILNGERAVSGKNPIAINPQLSMAAYLHSKDMAEQNFFSHISLDGRTFDQRIVAAGYTNYSALGENIAYAYGAPDAAKVFNMWKNSSGHYTNMMGDYNEAGLGVYSKNGYTYYTLDLGKSSVVPIPEFQSAALLLAFIPLASIFVVMTQKRGQRQRDF